jgi:type II secretory pathway pseudopilin PulG
MPNSNPIRRNPKPSEEGYLLLAVMFLMAILVLSLAAAAPSIAKSIQRDRDVETMERGKQYIRAIQLYYRRFHAYPPNEDALVKTNDIRFLRKRYLDPITGKDDWKPILFGQNKVPTAMGFFGQPLSTGGAIAGIGPAGGNGLNGSGGLNGANGTGGGGFGSSPGSSSSIFGSSGSSFGSSGSSFGSSGTSFGSSGSSLGSSASGTTAAAAGSTDSSTGSSANGASSTTSSSGASSSTGSTNSGSSGSTGTGLSGQTGQTFGGAGIIGFSPASPKQSILVYKKKEHYNEWEFTYDPIMEMMMTAGGNTGSIGQPAGSMPGISTPGAVGIPGITTPGSDNSNTTNSNSSGNNSNGAPSAPSAPPETSAPQQ